MARFTYRQYLLKCFYGTLYNFLKITLFPWTAYIKSNPTASGPGLPSILPPEAVFSERLIL